MKYTENEKDDLVSKMIQEELIGRSSILDVLFETKPTNRKWWEFWKPKTKLVKRERDEDTIQFPRFEGKHHGR